jgi:uncharacterized protein
MAKIVLLLIIGIFIYALFRGFFRSQVRQDREREAEAATAAGARGEDMVTCERCGVNMPRSEAREDGGRFVCAANPGCKPGA